VPGGSFLRNNKSPATISGFKLRLGGSSRGRSSSRRTTPGAYEDKPITCIDWYTLFAFCAWDGGRLPTDAEYGFAAGGGEQQRVFAWGNADPYFNTHKDFVVATLVDQADNISKQTWGPLFRTADPTGTRHISGPEMIAPPGLKALGNGRWRHADLTGNLLEWTLDEAPVFPPPCVDCARVNWPDPPQDQASVYPPQWCLADGDGGFDNTVDGARGVRGGSWDNAHELSNLSYYAYGTSRTYASIGGRCARD